MNYDLESQGWTVYPSSYAVQFGSFHAHVLFLHVDPNVVPFQALLAVTWPAIRMTATPEPSGASMSIGRLKTSYPGPPTTPCVSGTSPRVKC